MGTVLVLSAPNTGYVKSMSEHKNIFPKFAVLMPVGRLS